MKISSSCTHSRYKESETFLFRPLGGTKRGAEASGRRSAQDRFEKWRWTNRWRTSTRAPWTPLRSGSIWWLSLRVASTTQNPFSQPRPWHPIVSALRRWGDHRSDWLKEKQAYLERTENPTRVTDANWGLTYIGPIDCVENGESVHPEAQVWFSFFTSEPFKKHSRSMRASPENELTRAKKS